MGRWATPGAAAWPPPTIPGCTARCPARRAPWRRAAPARIPRRPGAPFAGTPRRVLDHLGHGLQAGVAGGVAQRVVHDARAQRIGDRREHHRHLRRHAVRRIHRLRRRRGADVQHGGLGAQQLGGQRVGVGHRALAVVLRQQDVVAHLKPRLGQASNKAPPIGFQRRMGAKTQARHRRQRGRPCQRHRAADGRESPDAKGTPPQIGAGSAAAEEVRTHADDHWCVLFQANIGLGAN